MSAYSKLQNRIDDVMVRMLTLEILLSGKLYSGNPMSAMLVLDKQITFDNFE
jgi:hypothetical protein